MVFEKKIKRLVEDIRETDDKDYKRLFFLQGEASFINQYLKHNSRSPRLIDLSSIALDEVIDITKNVSNSDFSFDENDDDKKDESNIDIDDEFINSINSLDVDELSSVCNDLGIKTTSTDKKYLVKLIRKEYDNENGKN